MSDDDMIRRGDVLDRFGRGGLYTIQERLVAIRALPAGLPDAAAHGAEHWDTLAPWSKYSSDVVLVVHHILTEPAVPTATVRFELPERAGSDVLGHCAADTVEEAVMGAIDAAQTKLRAMIDTGKEVMPDAAQSPPARHDIGPGDQAVAGAAPRRASGPIDSDAGFATSGAEARWIADIDAGVYDDAQPEPVAGAAQCCMCGKNGLSTEEDGGPQCELHDGRWVCSADCYDVALEIMLKPVAPAQKGDSHE